MSETTTIRISRSTHAQVLSLAAARQETVAETVHQAIRGLRQDTMGRVLHTELSAEESAWLYANAG
ncbi:MAG: hypothetical protein ACRC0L_07060 [Angustibacter sp.]